MCVNVYTSVCVCVWCSVMCISCVHGTLSYLHANDIDNQFFAAVRILSALTSTMESSLDDYCSECMWQKDDQMSHNQLADCNAHRPTCGGMQCQLDMLIIIATAIYMQCVDSVNGYTHANNKYIH